MAQQVRFCTAGDGVGLAYAVHGSGPPSALFAREIDGTEALSRLSVPVLVTHGLADAIVLPSMAEHVLEVCPTARASWYENVGHLPFVEDSGRFDLELAELVRQVA